MKQAYLVAAAGTVLATATGWSAEPFAFVSLPDTQIYSENRVPDGRFPPVTDPAGTGHIFGDQTRWVVDNATALNIRYVGHLGDIVQDGDKPLLAPTQWALAKEAMDHLLVADIPHGTVMGNHDDDGSHSGTYNVDYLAHFGPQVFAGRSWYVGASPSGGGNYQLLEHDGVKIGFINFSIDQPQGEIDWAKNIIQSNPDVLFVLGTHRYMYDYKLISGRYGEENITPLGTFTIIDETSAPDEVNPNTGQQLYDQVIAPHPNVLMIHAGHFHSEWLRLTGRPEMEQAIEMLTDYQDARNGGDGWLRLYTMDFETGMFSWDTYSPSLHRFRTTIDHFVETIQQAWVARDQVKTLLGFPNDAAYFAWLEANLKNNPQIPDGFLYLHPDLDEPEEQAYYAQYLKDMFNGAPPVGFDDITEWENLWMLAFAANQSNPVDFSDSVRSPQGTLVINYAAYIDSDRDGLRDNVDACPRSDMRPTVWIGQCNSGVPNDLLDDGCTIGDLIADLAAEARIMASSCGPSPN